MEIKLSIQRSFASGSHLMVSFQIHLMFYLLECMRTARKEVGLKGHENVVTIEIAEILQSHTFRDPYPFIIAIPC